MPVVVQVHFLVMHAICDQFLHLTKSFATNIGCTLGGGLILARELSTRRRQLGVGTLTAGCFVMRDNSL